MTSPYPAETNGGVVTSWIPLTTVFVPPESCTSLFRLNGPSLVAFDPGYGLDIDTSAVCAPPAVTTWWEQGRLGKGVDAGHTAVSIGPLTCPDWWQTVATSVKGGSSTAIMCCPSGYTLAHGVKGSIAGDCESSVSRGLVLTYASTPSAESTSWVTAMTTIPASSYVAAIAIVGWNVRATTSSSSSTPSATTSPPAPTSTTSSSTGTRPTSPTSSPSGGLYTAAAVGVGVALGVIGILALLVALFLLWRRKNKATAASAEMEQSAPPPMEEEPEPWVVHELGSDGIRAELETHRPAAELYGG